MKKYKNQINKKRKSGGISGSSQVPEMAKEDEEK
jgi:hypothetical protein